MEGLTRADLVRRAVLGGVAFAMAGSVVAMTAPTAVAGSEPPGEEDLAIVRLAAAAELLAIDFYTRALDSRHLQGAESSYLAGARKAEREHYGALAAVLGETAPIVDDFRFEYPTGSFGSRQRIVKLGVKLETAFVGAYLGGVAALADAALRGVASQIAASEGRHLGALAAMGGGSVPGPPFPDVLDIEQATDALAPYLGE